MVVPYRDSADRTRADVGVCGQLDARASPASFLVGPPESRAATGATRTRRPVEFGWLTGVSGGDVIVRHGFDRCRHPKTRAASSRHCLTHRSDLRMMAADGCSSTWGFADGCSPRPADGLAGPGTRIAPNGFSGYTRRHSGGITRLGRHTTVRGREVLGTARALLRDSGGCRTMVAGGRAIPRAARASSGRVARPSQALAGPGRRCSSSNLARASMRCRSVYNWEEVPRADRRSVARRLHGGHGELMVIVVGAGRPGCSRMLAVRAVAPRLVVTRETQQTSGVRRLVVRGLFFVDSPEQRWLGHPMTA